jgi:alpha-beta hydrolase superfamily lysophospholipase
MGGLLAADYARRSQKRLGGLVLLAPALRVHPTRFRPPPNLLSSFGSGVQALLGGRVPIDTDDNLNASTRVPEFAAAKKADPLCVHEVRPTYLARLGLLSMDWPEAGADLDLPLFVGVAGQDRIIDNQIARRAFVAAQSPAAAKTWRVYQDAYHTLLWDPITPEVVEDVVTWVLRHNP